MGIRLPSIQIGKFISREIAPLIPGGEEAAESINRILNKIKGKTAAGANVVPATRAALEEINAESQKKRLLTYALIGGGALLFLFLVMRRR